jgi:hypothetical protein
MRVSLGWHFVDVSPFRKQAMLRRFHGIGSEVGVRSEGRPNNVVEGSLSVAKERWRRLLRRVDEVIHLVFAVWLSGFYVRVTLQVLFWYAACIAQTNDVVRQSYPSHEASTNLLGSTYVSKQRPVRVSWFGVAWCFSSML